MSHPAAQQKSYKEIAQELLDRLRASGTLTDVNPGSVVRTLIEVFARELAEVYAQIGYVYEMGFIDTATGDSLNHLVAILGESRIDGNRVLGEAVFTREPYVVDRIVIPAGTELLVERTPENPQEKKEQIFFRTMNEAVLQPGQTSVTVAIMAEIPPGKQPQAVTLGKADVGESRPVTQVSPLGGIGSVYIPRPTAVRAHAETDEELRRRVKDSLQARGEGTYKALEHAILATGHAKSVTFRDASTSDGNLRPGELEILVDADLERPGAYESVWDAIHSTKGPGIHVKMRGITPRPLAFRIRIKPAVAQMSPETRHGVRQAVEQAVRTAVEALKPGERLLWNPLMAAVLSISGVLDITEDTRVSLDGKELPGLTREIPDSRKPFSRLERLVIAKGTNPITVMFEGEETIHVQIICSAAPADGEFKASVARWLAARLDDVNKAGGTRTFTFEEIDAALRKVPGAEALADATFAVRISDALHGGEMVLRQAGQSFTLGPNDVVSPHPDGPAWGGRT